MKFDFQKGLDLSSPYKYNIKVISVISLKLDDLIIVGNQTILPIHELDSCFRRNDISIGEKKFVIPPEASGGIHSLTVSVLKLCVGVVNNTLFQISVR